MRDKPRGHYIDEAERLAWLVKRHQQKFDLRHVAAADSILFLIELDPALIRNNPNMNEMIEEMWDAAAAVAMELMA